MTYKPNNNGFREAVEKGRKYWRPREYQLYDQGTTQCPKCKRHVSNRCDHKC